MTEAGTAGRSPSVRRVERLDALHGVPWVGSFGWRWRIQVSLGHALSLCAVVGLVVVASLVGVTALGSAVGVPPLPPPLELINQRLPGIFRLHMMTSGLALILLPWAIALRRRRRTHRAIGWITVTLLVTGLLASQPTALASEAVLSARLGFLAQGMTCLALLISAIRAARAGKTQRHAQLMWCVTAVVFGVVALRIMMLLALKLALPFESTYAVIA